MKKNLILILIILIVPLCTYFLLTRESLTPAPSIASGSDEVIKFASPMCYECQQLEKVFDEVFPKYNKDISLKKIDVTQRDDKIQTLISEYNVKLVPTTVFKNQDGKVTRRIEGNMPPAILDNYLKELINE